MPIKVFLAAIGLVALCSCPVPNSEPQLPRIPESELAEDRISVQSAEVQFLVRPLYSRVIELTVSRETDSAAEDSDYSDYGSYFYDFYLTLPITDWSGIISTSAGTIENPLKFPSDTYFRNRPSEILLIESPLAQTGIVLTFDTSKQFFRANSGYDTENGMAAVAKCNFATASATVQFAP